MASFYLLPRDERFIPLFVRAAEISLSWLLTLPVTVGLGFVFYLGIAFVLGGAR